MEEINYNGVDYKVYENETTWTVYGPAGDMEYPKADYSKEEALDDYIHLDQEDYNSRRDEIDSLVGGVATYNADPFEIADIDVAAEVYNAAMRNGVKRVEANNLSYEERQQGDWARWCEMLGADPEQVDAIYVGKGVIFAKENDINY